MTYEYRYMDIDMKWQTAYMASSEENLQTNSY